MKYLFWIPFIGLLMALLLSFKDDDGVAFLKERNIRMAYMSWQLISCIILGFVFIA